MAVGDSANTGHLYLRAGPRHVRQKSEQNFTTLGLTLSQRGLVLLWGDGGGRVKKRREEENEATEAREEFMLHQRPSGQIRTPDWRPDQLHAPSTSSLQSVEMGTQHFIFDLKRELKEMMSRPQPVNLAKPRPHRLLPRVNNRATSQSQGPGGGSCCTRWPDELRPHTTPNLWDTSDESSRWRQHVAAAWRLPGSAARCFLLYSNGRGAAAEPEGQHVPHHPLWAAKNTHLHTAATV